MQIIPCRGDKNCGANTPKGASVIAILLLELTALILTTAARALRILSD